MSDKTRPQHPHFWIPDEEVVQKPYAPTGRTNPRNVHHASHGQTLLRGLRSIEDFHARMSSPWANEMIVFKVELAPSEKLQNTHHQQFLRDKGIEVVAVRDRRTAVAKTSPTRFKRLKDKVSEYQVRGANADFQFVDGFSSFEPDDKHTESLRRLLNQPVVPDKRLDVQIVLLPHLTEAFYSQAINYLSERIREDGGELVRSPYRLADSTPVLRAEIPSGAIQLIAQEEVVYRVEETSFFRIIDDMNIPATTAQCRLAPDVVLDTLPVVAVLDSGVRFDHPDLDELIVRRWIAPGIALTNPSHGTGVASRVLFADQVEYQAAAGAFRPRCRIADACISDGQPVSQDQLIERIRGAVEALHPVARVFNLSFNASTPIEGDVQSLVGHELDVLAYKHGIQFVVSVGNHYLWRVPGITLGDILEDSDARVAAPGDSVFALTVGSLSRSDATGSVSQAKQPSPFSRLGPGFGGNPKPDLVAPGGNIYMDHETGEQIIPPPAAAYVLTPGGGIAPNCGTSHASPVVSGDLAVVHHSLPVDNLLLAKALLIHTADVCWEEDGLDYLQRQVYASAYGAGVSRADRALLSAASSVTFVRTGEMNRLTKERVKFHMPTLLSEQRRRNDTARVRVTCVSMPPIDRSKGTDYCSAYVNASLHKAGGEGALPSSNPAGGEGRPEWQPYQHFSKLFSRFNSGDWEVWLQLWTRWDMPDDQNVLYALAITVEDPYGALDVYSAIENEVEGRFMPLTRLRTRPR